MTKQEAEQFIQGLRDKYGKRIVSDNNVVSEQRITTSSVVVAKSLLHDIANSDKHLCCIGGALLAERINAMSYDDIDATTTYAFLNFPEEGAIGAAISTLNDLSVYDAEQFASLLIEYNDKGEFDMAWRVLETALTVEPKNARREFEKLLGCSSCDKGI